MTHKAQTDCIKRTRGGAVSVSWQSQFQSEPRQNQCSAIGDLAVEEVEVAETVFFDADSTTMQVVECLGNGLQFTVITNSPRQAHRLAELGHRVKLTGGSLGGYPPACSGPDAEQFITQTRISRLFLDPDGLQQSGRLRTQREREAILKTMLLEAASSTVPVTTQPVFDEQPSVQFGTLDDVDLLITDSVASAAHTQLQAAGVRI